MLTLQAELLQGSYKPSAVRGVQISKPQGGYLQLGIPKLRDRFVQQAMHQVLSARYEEIFSASSHGFRRGKNAHDALLQASGYVAGGLNWVVDLDLEKFLRQGEP